MNRQVPLNIMPLGRLPLDRGPGPDGEHLSGPGIRAFFNIAQEWALSVEEQLALLGLGSRSTLFSWKRAQDARLDRDQLERISHILGIYKALRILLPSGESAQAWVKKPNDAPLFEGRPALERMSQGILGLYLVRNYLDAQRGGWA
ncbi:MAG: MbcA/ParS/Xre antitoxin family protein [Geothrix sp.]|nr:MbcA/ParS/Xre antitoxin family protein [Geothrix sp.]